MAKVRSDPKTAITLAGLTLYAVLWTAYATFYQSFGLTPKDLGFGYLDLLAQTAVGAIGLTVLMGTLLSLYVLIVPVGLTIFRSMFGPASLEDGHNREDSAREAQPAAQRPDHPDPEPVQPRARRSAAAFVSVAALAAIGIYVWALATGGALHLVAVYATYCVVALVWIAAAVKWLTELDAPGRARLERHIAIAMVAAFLFVAAVLIAQAAADAHAVRQGRSTYPTVGGLRFASWGAERATLRWVGNVAGNDHPALAGCLMYLGTSDGTAYIYRADTKETLRLPASDVAVVTRDVTLTCERR